MVTDWRPPLAVKVLNSFLLFCLAAMLGGAHAAVALSFRFAATDGVVPARRARALSLVMGGGVAAGIIGPMLVTGTMHLWWHIPSLSPSSLRRWLQCWPPFVERGDAGGAHRGQRARRAVAARDCPPAGFCHYGIQRAVAYMVMNFLMTAAPLSMHMHGLSQQAANLGIQWHVMAMYGPDFSPAG